MGHMANRSTNVTNILISFGSLIFIAICIIAFLREEMISANAFVATILLLQILLGVIIVTTAINLTKKAYQLFLGLMIACYGILCYLMRFVLPYTVFQIWPIGIIVAGIIMIVCGVYKYKKFKFGFGIPGVVLICMGLWFMLFSFKIIKISFSTFATIAGPLFMLVVGVVLVLFFFAQQKHSQLVIKDDNQGDFGDEELSGK